MNRPKDRRELPDVAVDAPPRRSTMLCSLRVVPVRSEHFLGRRYVMELATASRARELRVFRSLELLMAGVAELGLREDVREGCIANWSIRDAANCGTLSCNEHGSRA